MGLFLGFIFCFIYLYVYFYAKYHTILIFVMLLEIAERDASSFVLFSRLLWLISGGVCVYVCISIHILGLFVLIEKCHLEFL